MRRPLPTGASPSSVAAQYLRRVTPASSSRSHTVTASYREDLTGQAPFADTGADRTISWSALGISCMISCANNYTDVAAAERLASVLQVVQAAIATHDPVLLPAKLHIGVTAHQPGQPFSMRWEPELAEAGAAQPSVSLPAWNPDQDPHGAETNEEAAEVALSIACHLSMLDRQSFDSIVIALTADGLAFKTMPHAHYDTVFAIVPEDDFAAAIRQSLRPLGPRSAHLPTAHPAMSASTTPGPGFSTAAAEQHVSEVYEWLAGALDPLLPNLIRQPQFCETVCVLRERGWKNWHILLAIANQAINCQLIHAFDVEGQFSQANEAADGDDADNLVEIPHHLLDAQSLAPMLGFSLPGLAAKWDLHPPTVPLLDKALEHLLATRYALWETDVAHEDPFTAA